jgi:hypothetical protein
MRTTGSMVSDWVVDLEDDVGNPDSTKIFVGAVAGIGILLSAATALGDATRKVFPNAGRVERANLVHQRAYALAGPVGEAVGVALAKPAPALRGLRSRSFYFLVGTLALAFSLYVGIGGTFNYLRNGGFRVLGLGHFRHNIPIYSVTMLLSVSAFAVAVVCAVAIFARVRTPRFAAYVIEHTPLGVYRP